jgi:predicted AlkP superfamily pyrophosphatase or phosphodiesterase
MFVLFSIDGMRPDGLLQAHAPNIHKLIDTGASTMRAQTVMPSVTLPCHSSMIRGVDVPRHGITGNTFQPIARPVPSVIDVASNHGLRCGFFYNWGPLRDLCDPESTAVSFYYRGHTIAEGDRIVADAAVRAIQSDKLDFVFVYLGYTDECGHENGWMTTPYLEAIANADKCVGQVLEAAGETHALVLSDHGGHGRSHGTDMPEDMTIPWILAGPGVPGPTTIDSPVRIYDTAPTIAHILRLPLAREWDGQIVSVG